MSFLWEVGFSEFVFVTMILGGGAAWMAGRATAIMWQSWIRMTFYIFLLTIALRFIHFSLFGGSFFLPFETLGTALQYYLIDFVVLMAAAATGRRVKRSEQMATQYSFLFDRQGPFSWNERR